METLSHILASFDIFQVIFAALPHMFAPLAEAFRGIWHTMADVAANQFSAHPGLFSGSILFLFVYAVYTGLSKIFRTKPAPVAAPSGRQSR